MTEPENHPDGRAQAEMRQRVYGKYPEFRGVQPEPAEDAGERLRRHLATEQRLIDMQEIKTLPLTGQLDERYQRDLDEQAALRAEQLSREWAEEDERIHRENERRSSYLERDRANFEQLDRMVHGPADRLLTGAKALELILRERPDDRG